MRNLEMEKAYQEEWIELLNMIQTRYAVVCQKGNKNRIRAMEKLIDVLLDVKEEKR